jgi:hypothetical protein
LYFYGPIAPEKVRSIEFLFTFLSTFPLTFRTEALLSLQTTFTSKSANHFHNSFLPSTELLLFKMAWPERCIICGKETAIECGVCKAAPYCSVECQKKDRPLHKILCGQYRAFLRTRPVPTDSNKKEGDVLPVTYKLAILFPATSETPQLIWAKIHTVSEFDPSFEKEEDPKYHFEQTPIDDLKDRFHVDNPEKRRYKPLIDRDLDIYMGAECLFKEPITKSLLTLNAGYSSLEHGSLALPARWAGNVVVFNMTRELLKHPKHGGYVKDLHNHVNLSDFRYAFEYLTRDNYIFESSEPNPYIIRKPGQ